MNIKPLIYEKLTARQRVIASFEALAREDEAEARRLIKTCRKKTYTMNDSAYVDRMEALHDIAMAVECDMRGMAICYLMEAWLGNRRGARPGAFEFQSPAIEFLQDMLSIRQAWHDVMKQEGIEPAIMEKAHASQRHCSVDWLLRIAEKMKLKPDPETVAFYKELLVEYLVRIGGESSG